MRISFISSKDDNEKRLMHSERDNRKTMIGNDTYEIIEEPFYSFLQKQQISLEERQWLE